MAEGKSLKTLIATVNFSDSLENKVQFFAKVYGIVHSLIDGQVDSLKMMDFSPKNLTVQCCDGEAAPFSAHPPALPEQHPIFQRKQRLSTASP